MASNDLTFVDSKPTTANSFAPETTDIGTVGGLTIKRPGYGLADGASVALGTTSDVRYAGSGGSYSAMRYFRSMADDLIASLVQGTTALAAITSTATWQSGVTTLLTTISTMSMRVGGSLVSAANPLPTQAVASAPLTRTKTGVVTSAANASQAALAANASRKRLKVQNLDATNDLWIGEGEDASITTGSLRLPPKALYEWPADQTPLGTLAVLGAAQGQRSVFWEYV